ncbi:MAG: hypothetical protein ACRCZG_02075, partial [Culicoidibacterales bacterium]
MNEQNTQQLWLICFMTIFVAIALLLLFFTIFFLGFESFGPGPVIFFIGSYFISSSLIAVMIENSTKMYQNKFKRQFIRTVLNLSVNFLIIVGLNLGITGITLSNVSV